MGNQDSSATPPAVPLPGVWRFGDAVLDEQLASLKLGATDVELDRSGYDVLLALLRHAGEVVTKEELLEAGWPGRVVSENSLAKAIGRLRQALGQQGASIRAVHGYGYRLASTVSYQAAADDRASVRSHAGPELQEGDALPQRPRATPPRRSPPSRHAVIARCAVLSKPAMQVRAVRVMAWVSMVAPCRGMQGLSRPGLEPAT